MELYKEVVDLWRSYKISSVADLDKHLDNFRILFAFHSGRIENSEITYLDTREIFENDKVVGYTGNPRALFEQQNQKLCYELLKDKIIDKSPISIKLTKEVHKILTSGTYDWYRYVKNQERPGEFKKHDYITGIFEVGLAADDVEEKLGDLFNEINDYSGDEILKVATYFHAKFEYIHPFADGNGRVGRTLMNFYLMTHNHPPLIVYNEDKQEYYECLQDYDQTEDIDPLFEFFQYQTGKTWKRTLALANGVEQGRKNLSDFNID